MRLFNIFLITFITFIVFCSNIVSQWVDQKITIPDVYFSSICFAPNGIGVIAGANGTILYTTNAGNSWSLSNTNTTVNLTNAFYINNKFYVVGDSGKLLVSNVFGNFWQPIKINITEKLNSIWYCDSLNGWIAGSQAIYNTTDGGISWNKNFSYPKTYFDAVNFKNNNYGIVVGTSLINSTAYGVVFRTTDKGKNWNLVFTTYNGELETISIPDDSTVYVAGDNNGIAKSTDGGNTFTQLTPVEPSLYYWQSCCFIDRDKGWISGWYGFILKTTDGGKQWITYSPPLKDQGGSLNSIVFIDSNTGWAVGNFIFNSKVLKTTNGGITFVELEKQKNNFMGFELSQNYPNPFNPTTIINYELKSSAHITLNVYDILGRRVASLVNGYQNHGIHKINFNASGLPGGIYIYTLTEGNKLSRSKKMVLIR